MKWQLAWIALIAACVLVFGWFIYAYFADLVLARPTAEGLEIIAPSHDLIGILWPLIVAGALGSAIPAWSFIVWISSGSETKHGKTNAGYDNDSFIIRATGPSP